MSQALNKHSSEAPQFAPLFATTSPDRSMTDVVSVGED